MSRDLLTYKVPKPQRSAYNNSPRWRSKTRLPRVAPLLDRLPLDQFQSPKRADPLPLLPHPRVGQCWVIERSEYLAFLLETRNECGGHSTRLQELDCNLLLKCAIRPLSEIDEPHSASADFAD